MQGMAIVNAEEKITYCRCPENILLLLLKKKVLKCFSFYSMLCAEFL